MSMSSCVGFLRGPKNGALAPAGTLPTITTLPKLGFDCYATPFMVSFLRFLAHARKMPGFPTHIVGTPGNGDRDTEGAPHNSGVPLTSFRIKSPFGAQGRTALQGQSRR